VSTLSRDEAGLFDGTTAAAIEDRETLGIVGLDAAGIDVHHQLADLAAGRWRALATERSVSGGTIS
jgi:hypothetical protein